MHPFKPGASLRIASELQDALNLHPFKPSVSLRLWKDFQDALLIHPLKRGASFRIVGELQDALNLHLLNKLVPINRTRIFSEKMYGFDLTSGQTFVSDRLKMLNISSYSGQTSA